MSMEGGGPHSPWDGIIKPFEKPEPKNISIVLSEEQAAMVVFSLMEQAKGMSTPDQIEWSRLGIALNDLIVGEDDEPAQSA